MLTESTSTGTPSRPSMKPSQRRSSATLPTSWLTQIALVTPASFIILPPPRPASYSVWPTCTATPSSSRTSEPEFMEMTGMPDATAFLMASPSASASGTDTTRPSGCEATAASMICAICTMSKVSGARYSTVTPRSSAAWSTPFLTTDQNGSAAWPWLTTTNRMSCAAAEPAIPRAAATRTALPSMVFMLVLPVWFTCDLRVSAGCRPCQQKIVAAPMSAPDYAAT